MKASAFLDKLLSRRSGYVVTDERGLLVHGKRFPKGTPIEDLPAAPNMLRIWRGFKQIGLIRADESARLSKVPAHSAPRGVHEQLSAHEKEALAEQQAIVASVVEELVEIDAARAKDEEERQVALSDLARLERGEFDPAEFAESKSAELSETMAALKAQGAMGTARIAASDQAIFDRQKIVLMARVEAAAIATEANDRARREAAEFFDDRFGKLFRTEVYKNSYLIVAKRQELLSLTTLMERTTHRQNQIGYLEQMPRAGTDPMSALRSLAKETIAGITNIIAEEETAQREHAERVAASKKN